MRSLLAAFVLLLAGTLTSAAETSRGPELTPAQWREDLHYLVEQIQKVHPNPFHQVSQSQFVAAVATLDSEIPALSDHEIEVRLAQLIAMLGEGHSRLSFPGLQDPMSDVNDTTPYKYPSLAFHRLPVQLYLFADGLFVVGATSEYEKFIGSRVTEIGTRSAQSAVDLIEPAINRDNDMGARLIGPDLVAIPEVLRAFHIVPDQSRVRLGLKKRDGAVAIVQMQPLAADSTAPWVHAKDAMHLPNSSYVAHANENLWVEYDANLGTLLVHINAIQDMPGQSVAKFASHVETLAASHVVKRFVIDFRDCHGGDNQKFRALLLTLVRNKALNQRGRLFVLINRATFSAAVNAASDLERLSNAIFVGEPTAGAPSSWGDPRKIVLPNSGLIARVSSIYWRDWTANASRPWIAPDIATPLTSAEYFAGHDPFMAAVLAFPQQSDFVDVLPNVVRSGASSATVLRLYYQHVTDAQWSDETTEGAMQNAGAEFLARKAYDDAYLMFAVNFRDYPNSLGLAIRAAELALASDPSNDGLKSLAGKLHALANSQHSKKTAVPAH